MHSQATALGHVIIALPPGLKSHRVGVHAVPAFTSPARLAPLLSAGPIIVIPATTLLRLHHQTLRTLPYLSFPFSFSSLHTCITVFE